MRRIAARARNAYFIGMDKWRSLAERQIRKAEAEGKLSGLEGEGAPLPNRPGDALVDAGEAAGYRTMAEAGAVPEEFRLKEMVRQARKAWQAAADPAEKKRLMAKLAEAQMRYEIARDSRRKFMK